MIGDLNAHIPHGPLDRKWTSHKDHARLVNPNNRRKFEIIVVGSGLAGASAAATLGELGYRVQCFCYQDSPRRAHSIAAQGGINAAKNYQNDGDSVYRLFYDTIKGGDFRSREANVYRLAEVSVNIIDQCVAQGVPFAREYGGYWPIVLSVARRFHEPFMRAVKPVSSSCWALRRFTTRSRPARCKCFPRRKCSMWLWSTDMPKGLSPGTCDGRIERLAGDAVVLATGGYGNVFYLSTNARGCNVTATYRAHKKGALFANPCFTQIHPTCIPQSGDYQSKLTLMSESLRNDGGFGFRRKEIAERSPNEIPKRTAIIISNESIRASEICRRATSPRARPRKFAMKAAASVRRSRSLSRFCGCDPPAR